MPMKRGTFLAGAAAAGVTIASGRRAFGDASARVAQRTVRVHIFSGLRVDRVDVSSQRPLSITSGGQTQSMPSISLDASAGPATIVPGDLATIAAHIEDGSTISRRYAGAFSISGGDGGLLIVNAVDLEPYVGSVMESEISPSWHPEALKAQAIAVRTYALRRVEKRASFAYDVTDDTTNQVYHGTDGITPPMTAAANATEGRVLVFNDEPADVWYHSACGGHTADPVEIAGTPGPSYLLGIADVDASGHAYCDASPYSRWRNSIAGAEIATVFGIEGKTLSALTVTERWPEGRVKIIRASFSDGAAAETAGHMFYSRAGLRLGYKVIPSTFFDVALSGDAGIFTGRGVGHGVGMCQWGAQGRARAGQTAKAILAAYFPGTTLK